MLVSGRKVVPVQNDAGLDFLDPQLEQAGDYVGGLSDVHKLSLSQVVQDLWLEREKEAHNIAASLHADLRRFGSYQ